MPECLLLSYHDNLDRLRAERQLDAAQASSVPHLTKDDHKAWYRHVQRRTQRRLFASEPLEAGPSQAGPTFTVNGRPVDKQGLARWLAATFSVPARRGALPVNGATHGQVRP